MKATARKPIVRSAPKPPNRYAWILSRSGKPVRGTPFALLSRLTGEVTIEGHLIVVPDDASMDLPPAFLPGLPPPTVIRRKQMACLLRAWRNHPDTTLAQRNFPTVTDLVGMVIRENFSALLSAALTPSKP